MTSAILAVIFILLLFFACSLQRVFYHESTLELKRRARRGEAGASQLYRLAAHGENLRLALWILIVISAALGFVFVGKVLAFWPALVLILIIVWLSFVWLPNSRVSRLELITIGWSAPALAWLLEILRGPLALAAKFTSRWRHASFHTGLYSADDLLDLLDAQKRSPDNRIDGKALEMAMNALMFEEKSVESVMTPRRLVKLVSAASEVTPKLIDELHKSGAGRFLVYDGKPDDIVGTLALADLIDLKKSGHVSSYCEHKVCYLHEDFSLRQVLAAFHKTHQHLFVVVNKFEDFVGVITLEDVLEQVVGPVASDFEDYHDRHLVAEHQAAATHIAREAAGTEPEQEEELVAEVIE